MGVPYVACRLKEMHKLNVITIIKKNIYTIYIVLTARAPSKAHFDESKITNIPKV